MASNEEYYYTTKRKKNVHAHNTSLGTENIKIARNNIINYYYKEV